MTSSSIVVRYLSMRSSLNLSVFHQGNLLLRSPEKNKHHVSFTNFFMDILWTVVAQSSSLFLSLSHTHRHTQAGAYTHTHARQQETEIFLNRNHTVSILLQKDRYA